MNCRENGSCHWQLQTASYFILRRILKRGLRKANLVNRQAHTVEYGNAPIFLLWIIMANRFGSLLSTLIRVDRTRDRQHNISSGISMEKNSLPGAPIQSGWIMGLMSMPALPGRIQANEKYSLVG